MNSKQIEQAYQAAKDHYAEYHVDTDQALKRMRDVLLSLHCWQGDDVGGFESPDSVLAGGGIQVTGNYAGKARTVEELRQDLDTVFSLLPGTQKVNLHATYGEFGGKKVDRDQIEPQHFKGWMDWAAEHQTGLDFNCTCFSHPKADSGYTLSSKDDAVRSFWIEHVKRCREIADAMGKTLNIPTIHNIWIPDGSKDIPVDRYTHRRLLKDALDEIFQTDYNKQHMNDSIESKLFGIGSEAMVVGSYEFYFGYAVQHNKLICLDNGHYHPTEQVSDKISAALLYIEELMLHLTRGVRWDSDHVVTFNPDITAILQEVVRCGALDRVHIGLDFFDASINRIGAYVTGARAALKALLFALLEPSDLLKEHENNNRLFERLFLLERMKSMPWGAVWDYYCLQNNVPADDDVINQIQEYETNVLSKR